MARPATAPPASPAPTEFQTRRRRAAKLPAVPTLLQPLVATVPLQVFSAEVARARGYDVDKPRNLAKSVTVE